MNTFQKTTLRATLIAATLAAMPFGASAAGLGRISVLSALGQPLRAEIELTATGDELGSMSATVAAPTAFKDAGIAYVPVLRDISMSVERRGSRSFLRLSSTRPINEPFVDMLVELNWSAGRLMREYTFLLDPPDMPAPAAAANVGTPVSRPVARAARPIGGDYRVQRGDTLGKIARQNKPDGVTMDQMLVALYRANPDAFIDENINRLRAGVILNVPDAGAAAAVPRQEARQQVIAHAADFNAYRRRVAERVAATEPAAASESSQASSGKITARVEETPSPVTESPDQVKVSKSITDASGASADGATSDRLRALEEDIVARDKALAEANDRLGELERNIAELQKLIEMKNESLAALQQQAQGGTTEPAPVVPEPVVEPTPAEPPVEPAQVETPTPPPAADTPAPDTPASEAPASEAPADAPMPAGAQDALDKELQDLVTPPTAEAPPAQDVTPEPAPTPEPPPPPEPAPKPAPVTPPPAPQPEPSFLDSLMGNPALLYGGGAVLIALLGYGLVRSRKKSGGESSGSETAMASVFPPDQNSVFGETGGQSVDTGSSSLIQTDFSQSGLSAIDTDEGVDPVAEADVYMAYGRDAQAEEILLDALKADPSRTAIHLKLLEIYSQRKNLKQFETTATELYTVTGGKGEAWEKAVEMGLKLDPDNPLFTREAIAEPVVGDSAEADTMGGPADDGGFKAPGGTATAAAAGAAAGAALAGAAAASDTDEEAKDEVDDIDAGLDFANSIPNAETPSPSQMKDTWAIPGELNQYTDSDLEGLANEPKPDAGPTEEEALGVDTGDLDFNLDLDEPTPEADTPAQADSATDEGVEFDTSFDAADSSLEFNLDLDEPPPAGESMAETSLSGMPAQSDLSSTDVSGELAATSDDAPAGDEVVDLESTDVGTSSGIDFESVLSTPAETPEEADDGAVVDLEKTNFDGSLLDFDFELDEDKGEQEMMATSLDLSDINLDLEGADAAELPEPADETPAEVPAVEPEPIEDVPDLDEVAPEAPAAETPAEPESPSSFEEQSPSAAPTSAEEEAMMASLTKSVVTSLTDSRAMPELPADEELNQEVDTKLELARAYEEMGDAEGARELLDEVMRDGDDAQQEQARSILARLG